jgi:hypothetical protein
VFRINNEVELGALIIEILQAKGIIDLANVVVYITILVCSSRFTCRESIKTLLKVGMDQIKFPIFVIEDRSLVFQSLGLA